MIRFACTCGHGFEVADDEAGGFIQCTTCGRLNDVPNHSDLLSLAPDGTYGLDSGEPPAVDPHRMADLQLVYAKTKLDEQGNEIDLRGLPAGRRPPRGEEARVAQVDDDDDEGDLDLKSDDEPAKLRPRYDPETGELVRELPLRHDVERPVDPSTIPMAKAAINYAAGGIARRVGPLRIAAELFMPLNLAVMSFIVIANAFVALVFVASLALIFLWPALLIVQGLILAHYANVIDETGREERDELPRPLRDFSFHDDMWRPFVQMGLALMLAYAPAIVLASYLPGPRAAWLLLALIVGTVIAPAAMLTTTSSGAMNNLRPDRLLGLMRVAGLHYVGAVILWSVTWPIYFVVGWMGVCWCAADALGIAGNELGAWGEWYVVVPALLVGIYLMHLYSWYMGLVYRAHYDQFPWVLQYHERTVRRPGATPTHADKLGRRQRRRVGRGDPVVPPDAPGPATAKPVHPLTPAPAAPTGRPATAGARDLATAARVQAGVRKLSQKPQGRPGQGG